MAKQGGRKGGPPPLDLAQHPDVSVRLMVNLVQSMFGAAGRALSDNTYTNMVATVLSGVLGTNLGAVATQFAGNVMAAEAQFPRIMKEYIKLLGISPTVGALIDDGIDEGVRSYFKAVSNNMLDQKQADTALKAVVDRFEAQVKALPRNNLRQVEELLSAEYNRRYDVVLGAIDAAGNRQVYESYGPNLTTVTALQRAIDAATAVPNARPDQQAAAMMAHLQRRYPKSPPALGGVLEVIGARVKRAGEASLRAFDRALGAALDDPGRILRDATAHIEQGTQARAQQDADEEDELEQLRRRRR